MTQSDKTIGALVEERNAAKLIFTAGPASLLAENLTGLRPCFGRGDPDYEAVEAEVLDRLKAMSGHARIARMQGSASLALEIMVRNFLHGRVLVVSTGYYSDRLHWLAECARRSADHVREVQVVPYDAIEDVSGRFDWVLACSTETSRAYRLPIRLLADLSRRLNAQLMLDATASIGLEGDHDLADVVAYSSCKGLFGLTGACFIAHNAEPDHEADSFYLNLATHRERRMTGPYHAIASLADVLPRHSEFREAVVVNKTRFATEMAAYLSVEPERQPLLCTHVTRAVVSDAPGAVLYHPRSQLPGSVVCHLGEAHLGSAARGDILRSLRLVPVQEGADV